MNLLILVASVIAASAICGYFLRLKQLDYADRAERMCATFGQLRHDLIMALARRELTESDEVAFRYVNSICTAVLHIPASFRELSTHVCYRLVFGSGAPPGQSELRGKHLSPLAGDFMSRSIKAMDSLIQEFSHPLLIAISSMNDSSVLETMAKLGERRREIEKSRDELRNFRNIGADAIAA